MVAAVATRRDGMDCLYPARGHFPSISSPGPCDVPSSKLISALLVARCGTDSELYFVQNGMLIRLFRSSLQYPASGAIL